MSRDESRNEATIAAPEDEELVDGAELTAEEALEFEEIADELAEEVKYIEEQALFDMRQSVSMTADDVEPDDIDVAAAAGGYRVVDLRGQICPAWSSWGNSGKSYGVVGHYNGGPVPARAWTNPIAWIRFIDRLHRRRGRFAPGWQINGIAYCEWILGRTVYRLRNYAADLPHCGNGPWNKNGIGMHLPIGGNQRPIDAGVGSLWTMRQRANDHLRAMGHRGSGGFKGHQELFATACPGPYIMAGVRDFRG